MPPAVVRGSAGLTCQRRTIEKTGNSTSTTPAPVRAAGREETMMAKKGGSDRIERDAGTGRYVPTGTEKKHPKTTVTEPRKPNK